MREDAELELELLLSDFFYFLLEKRGRRECLVPGVTRFPTRSNGLALLGLVSKGVVELAEGVVTAAGRPVSAALSAGRGAAGILRQEILAAVGADGADKLVICDGGDGGDGGGGVAAM